MVAPAEPSQTAKLADDQNLVASELKPGHQRNEADKHDDRQDQRRNRFRRIERAVTISSTRHGTLHRVMEHVGDGANGDANTALALGAAKGRGRE